MYRWTVELDGEVDGRFASRAKAREYASWLRRHPAVSDRRKYAWIGNTRVSGRVVVVYELERVND